MPSAPGDTGTVFSVPVLPDCLFRFTKNSIIELLNQVLTFLGLIGVLVDPTTAGIGDSERALGYEEPWDDGLEN